MAPPRGSCSSRRLQAAAQRSQRRSSTKAVCLALLHKQHFKTLTSARVQTPLELPRKALCDEDLPTRDLYLLAVPQNAVP